MGVGKDIYEENKQLRFQAEKLQSKINELRDARREPKEQAAALLVNAAIGLLTGTACLNIMPSISGGWHLSIMGVKVQEEEEEEEE